VLIVVDPHSGVPVFRQLMDQVRFHIVSGLLAPGVELPPTRTLSAELGINPMTISKAYSLLERDGLLERRPGRPLVVKEMAGKELQTRKIEQLRNSLAEPVRIVCQLGIDPDQAKQAFSEMLSAAISNQ
jgi:GntR family transcriptional regulator